MKVILDHYGLILQEVDDWFASCLGKFPGRISCRYGCAECCRGLFDITLLDALYLKRGFDLLPESVKNACENSPPFGRNLYPPGPSITCRKINGMR